jgi:hypothetical protein
LVLLVQFGCLPLTEKLLDVFVRFRAPLAGPNAVAAVMLLGHVPESNVTTAFATNRLP